MRSLEECKKNKNTDAGSQFLPKGEFFSSYLKLYLQLSFEAFINTEYKNIGYLI